MSVLASIYKTIAGIMTQYPALTSTAVSIAAALAAKFGFNLTATEITAIVSAVAVIVGIFVHATSVPKAKLPG